MARPLDPLDLTVLALSMVLLLTLMMRKDPSMVNPFGSLQPIANALKLFMKESVQPNTSSPILFLLMTTLTLTLALILWVLLPSPITNLTILLNITLSSLAVYFMLGSEWPPSSKHALTKALRYGLTLGLTLLNTIIFKENFTLPTSTIPYEYIWLTLAAMWYVLILAETNRLALFPPSEHSNILLLNTLTAIILLWMTAHPLSPHSTKNDLNHQATLLTALLRWVWTSFPQFRLDELDYLVCKTYSQSLSF